MAAIKNIQSASDPCDLLGCLFQATWAFGAQESACVHVVPDPERATKLMVLLACDAEQAYARMHRGTSPDHPWLRYARDHVEPVLASTLSDCNRLQDEADQLGLQFDSILIVPTHSGGSTGRFGALLLDTTKPNGAASVDLPSYRVIAHSLARELHDWWVRRTRTELQNAARLRSEDLRLLALERQGMSTKQIARLVDTSITAVDSRFQRINAKMGTANRRHAALRAAIHELL